MSIRKETLSGTGETDRTEPAPSFLPKSNIYPPGAPLLPHELRYNYAYYALEECRIESQQRFPLTRQQQERILKILEKDKTKFLAFDIIGWISTALNFAVFVPILVQAIETPENGTNIILTWISLINQLFWLVYAIGIRSYPILILAILLIPLLLIVIILLYLHQQ